MSFIFQDRNLLEQLIKAAQSKPGIQVTPETISGYQAATRMLYKLQDALGDPNAPKAAAPLSSEYRLDPEEGQLKVANLRTLGDFINWAAERAITWGGKRIAWTPAERNSDMENPEVAKAWAFTSYTPDRSRQLNREPDRIDAYANKEGLASYLAFLRDSKEAKENNVFSFMIGSLIAELNRYLRIKGETPVAIRTTTPGTTIDPKLIIDVVPTLLDLNNPFEWLDERPFTGNKRESNWLQYIDIQTLQNFSNWLRERKVKNSKGEEVPVMDTNGDPCIALQVLYRRAVRLSEISKGESENYINAVNEYINKIKEYSKSFTKDGVSCDVTSAGTGAGRGRSGTGGTDGTDGTEGGGRGRGRGGPGSGTGTGGTDQRKSEIIRQIASLYPLDASGVSFEKISAFCIAIEKFGHPPWNSATTKIKDEIRQAKSTLSTKKPTSLIDGIPLGTPWSRTPSGDYIIPFAGSFDNTGNFCHYMRFVESIVDDTASIIISFMTKAKDELSASEYAMATSQVGSGSNVSGSIYYYNKSAIANYLTMGSCYIK